MLEEGSTSSEASMVSSAARAESVCRRVSRLLGGESRTNMCDSADREFNMLKTDR